MAYKPSEIVARAKKMKKDGIVYGFGYKFEKITKGNLEKFSKEYAYTDQVIHIMRSHMNKIAIDCSGFVNKAAGTSLGRAEDIKHSSPKTWKISDPSHVQSGMFVWRDGHIGLVYIEKGKKRIIEARCTEKGLTDSSWEERAHDFTLYGKIKGVSYAATKTSVSDAKNYSQKDFVNDVRKCLGLGNTSSRAKVLSKTYAVGVSKNRYGSVITPIERRMKALGLYKGSIEVDKSKSPIFGPKLEAAVMAYQKKYVFHDQPSKADGSMNAHETTWKHMLGA